MRPFNIDARLIRYDHAFLKGLRLAGPILPAKACRSFMNIQKISNAMSGSVIVIKPPVPEWLACDHV